MDRLFPLLAVLIFSSVATAWGAKGHQIIAYVGGDLSSSGAAFWKANLEPLRTLSTVPDRVWKASTTKPQEEPMHFFEIDTYYSSSEFDQIQNFPSSYIEAIHQYTESRVIDHGTAPWRIRQLYRLALQALRQGDKKLGLQYAGTMAHYIGDLSQPLHVTENYDGQMTGNQGIHRFFETDILKDEIKIREDVKKRAQKLLQSRNFIRQFESQLMDVLLQEVQRSIAFEKKILDADHQWGRGAKGVAVQLDLAKDRMADGAAIYAIVLSRLWQDSGLIANSTPLTIKDPSWIRPDFSHLNFARQAVSAANDRGGLDCDL
jgi:hypothetical protein